MASSKISDLIEATSLADTDLFVIAQEDAANKKVTLPTLRAAVASDPIEELFGAPDAAHEFDTSSLAGFTLLGSPDVEDADTSVPDHYFIRDDATSSAAVGRYKSPPSTPYTAITKADSTVRRNFNKAGLFIGESSPGQMDVVMWCHEARELKTERFSSPTSFGNGFGNSEFGQHHSGPIWMAIVVNSSTDVDYLSSPNGKVWAAHQLARTPPFTIGALGIFISNEQSGNATAAAFDFLRIWNSALTFPGVA